MVCTYKTTFNHIVSAYSFMSLFDFLAPKVPGVTVEELYAVVQAKKKAILLDVRTPQEYSRGSIKGSINVPLDTVPEKIAAVVSDKKSLVYVFCLSGSRSVMAVDSMVKLGYTNVFDVKNGLLAWRVHKYPEEK